MNQLSCSREMTCTSCFDCMCRDCLYWWSSRCPYGGCYDDYRARVDPYDRAHPGEPPRTGWTNWKRDQAYWCRGVFRYPARNCSHYVHYEPEKHVVRSCLDANVQVFQDGYILCNLVNSVGCAECYRRFEERMDARYEIQGQENGRRI